MYKETFAYHSDTNYINPKCWQKWEMKDDTLIFYGLEKAEMPDGKDVTKEWKWKVYRKESEGKIIACSLYQL